MKIFSKKLDRSQILFHTNKSDNILLQGLISAPAIYGEDYCPKKGRIPGAKWIEWLELMTENEENECSSFKSRTNLKKF